VIYNLITSPDFLKDLKRLSKKYPSISNDIAQLGDELKIHPDSGIPIGQSCYKIRLAIKSKGKGKSGGARVITYVYVSGKIVYLLSIFDKSERENLSDAELKELLKKIK